MYTLERQQWVPRPRSETFRFFSDAANLELLTPPWLRFEIITPLPIAMTAGVLIDYRIRLGGIPMKWRTEIEEWIPGERFVDVQQHGPYRFWQHIHVFTEMASGTLITDTVRYQPPFGPLGKAAHAVSLRSVLARIFDYRYRVIGNVLGNPNELESADSAAVRDREML